MANAPRHGVSRISREAIAVLIESIEAAKNGLQWYRDNQPQADSQADDEMHAKLDRCLTLLASAADDDRYSLPPVVMTGYQLQAALGFLAPDGTAEQMEQQVCVASRNQVRDEDEGTTLPAGLFLWLEEYPEEGLMPLDNVPEISMHSLMPTMTPPEVVNQGLLTCACRWHGDEQLQRCKLHESHVEAIHEWAGRAKHAESQLAMKVPARDELIAVLRKSALALPRFSFLLLHGGVSRVIDPSGRWVELDEVAALLEPERIDLLARDIAYPAAQAPGPGDGDVRELRKWLNEQPNRPIDRDALARLLHAVENAQPVGEIVTDCDGEAVLGDEVSWRAGMPPAGTKLYTAPVPCAAVGAEDARDAARYRWLRDKPTWSVDIEHRSAPQIMRWSVSFPSYYGTTETEDSLNAAIDAEMADAARKAQPPVQGSGS